MMIFSIILLAVLATVHCGIEEFVTKADFVAKEHVTCARTFSKIGCFKKTSTPTMKMVINDQDPTSKFNKGYLTNVSSFHDSTHSLACRCAAYATGTGHTYFSLRFWGQCFVGKDYANVQKLVDDPKVHASPDCANPQFQTCSDSHAHECLAWDNADYIYSVYGANGDDPNINGSYTAWSKYTKCSKECGLGVETRERTCTNPLPKGTGNDCSALGPTSDSRPCKIKECKIDGGFTLWTKFSVCSRSCGGGIQRRHRGCSNPWPKNGGADCEGNIMESRVCQVLPCPVHGSYSEWSPFGPCTASCGLGEKTRVRHCNNPTPAHSGRTCDYLGIAEETSACTLRPCPIDGGYTQWGKFTFCTKSCGGGQKSRIRLCTNPRPAYGGKRCIGSFINAEECNTDPCPIDGGWTPYSKWDNCSVPCGGGITHRRRQCTNPEPQHGGEDCDGPNKEQKECNTHHCPIDGGYTEWSEFEECSVSCAGGIKERSRECTNPEPKYGGKQCPGPAINTAECNTDPCPIDGGYTEYGPWVTCTKSCGGGTQYRTRNCSNPEPKYGGLSCAFLGGAIERRECETQACARFTKYGPWSKCSLTCAGGTQMRKRTCWAPGRTDVDCSHLGEEIETRTCEPQPCPIPGGWSKWTPWSDCSRKCGPGNRKKTRTCTNPEPQYGGPGCPGNHLVQQHCNIKPCPIDGKWTAWSQYGTCSVSCGGGTQGRNRECSNPRPQHGGASCTGLSVTSRACNPNPCPIDGEWTKWDEWAKCSVSCGGGRTFRQRTCTNPEPKYGGDHCLGNPSQSKECGTNPCPIDGIWTDFSEFSSCSKSCGGGAQVSTRSCDAPSPQYGGNACFGAELRSQDCNTHHCPVDGKYTEWSEFSTCSFTCGGGTQKRERTCIPEKYGGKPCSVLGNATDVRECNTELCPVQSFHVAIACQNSKGKLNCKKGGGKIHILEARFGREKIWICGYQDWFDLNCKLPPLKGEQVASGICEGKESCEIPATVEQFGIDPCPVPNTPKYLEVMYQCYGGRYPDLADEEEEYPYSGL